MKNIPLYFLFVSTLFFSCTKEPEQVFDKSPDERLNETLAGYQKQLSGAQYGWKAVVFPAAGGAYAFYFKFNDSNRVQMVSDFDSNSARILKESSFRLKALQQPSLIFDTYSYLHVLADPDPGISNLDLRIRIELTCSNNYRSARGRELYSVRQQIRENLLQPLRVSPDSRNRLE